MGGPVRGPRWSWELKHMLGYTIAVFALVLLTPWMLLIALAVRLSSPGPVLFRQRRVGIGGHEFELLKFRTMRIADPCGPAVHLRQGSAPGGVEGLDRRTRVGRFLRASSLDELPQLLNVMRGEMALVGPRPERPEYVRQFSREIDRYAERHRVRSGITGWAQVKGLRGQTSIAERAAWDNAYIEQRSLLLDLRILALTVIEVLRCRAM